jgi:tetratricopeptide (TPR) repeat protein
MKAVSMKAASLSLWALAGLTWGPWASNADAQEARADQRFLDETVLRAEALLKDGSAMEAASVYIEFLDKTAGEITKLSQGDLEARLGEVMVALYRLDRLCDFTGGFAETKPALERWARLSPDSIPGAAALRGAVAEATSFARYLLGFALLETGGTEEEAREAWRPLFLLESWRVIGPFDNERGSAFLTQYGPEKEIRLDAGYDGKKRPVSWRPLPQKPLAGKVDFRALYEPKEEALAYALTFVSAEKEEEAALRFGSDEGFRVWVNGALVTSGDVHRRSHFDQNAAGIRLQKGWNSILFKVTQSTEDWELAARLTQRDGSPLRGVVEGLPEDGAALPRPKKSPNQPPEKSPNQPPEKSPNQPPEKSPNQPPEKSPNQPPGALPTPQAASAGQSAAGTACAEGVEGLLRRRIEQNPADARTHYLLGMVLLEKHAHDVNEHPDTEAFRRAIQLDAGSPVYNLVLARSQEREATIAAQKDENAWRQAMEKASSLGSSLADYQLARYYKDSFTNLQNARRYLRSALAKSPGFEDAIVLRGEVEMAMEFPRARERAEEEAWALPRKTLRASSRHASTLLSKGLTAEAEKLLREVLSRNALNSTARERLAKLLQGQGRNDEAMDLLKKGSQLDPLDVFWLQRIAQVEESLDHFEEAIGALDQALKIRPEDHGLHEKRGRLLLRLERKDDALAALDRALLLQPNLPQVREYVEFLRATKSTFEDEFRQDVAAMIRESLEKKEANEKGDPARVLLDVNAINVNRDGTTKEFSQKVVKILNDRGIRLYNSYGTQYAEGEQVLEFKKARVSHPDGTTAEAKLSRFGEGRSGDGDFRGASVDLPPLSAGDVVEIEFVREDIAQSFFGDYFGHREVFQESVPVEEKVFSIRVPADRKIFFHKKNFDLEPKEERDEKTRTITYTWTRKDIPKIEEEPAMPDSQEVCPVLEASTFESWDAFNKWYWSLIRKQFEASPELSKKVRELTSGADTDLERIRAIYDFVVTDVRYNAWEFGVHGFKPYNAATIFARKFGDCKDKATLLSVMLREVGVRAHPVLIFADDRRGEEDLSLPMVNHFNHCITYLPAEGGRRELYLDGTAQFHNMEELPSMDRGAKVLVVKEEGGAIQPIPWNEPPELSLSEENEFTLRSDLGAALGVRAKARGDFAVYVRESFEIAAQRKTNLERVFGRRFAASSVKTETFSNLSRLEEPVSFSVDIDVPRLVTEAPEGLTVKAPEDFFGTGRSLSSIGSLEKRSYDVLLGNPRSSFLRTTYLLPDGLKFKSLPPLHDVQSRFGRLKVTYREDGPRKLVAERLIEITSPRVSIGDYAEFREFAASINRLEDEKIILERG